MGDVVQEENLRRQQEEIEVLNSIYEENMILDSETSFSIFISGDQDRGESAELGIRLSPAYPGSAPPTFQLSAPFLSTEEKQRLSNEFNELYLDNVGESLVFIWAEHLRTFLVEREEVTTCDKYSDDAIVDDETALSEALTRSKLEHVCPDIVTGDIIEDRKSVFQGHTAVVKSLDEVRMVISRLYENKKIAQATHNIYAYRIQGEGGRWLCDCEDDGEDAAGGRLLHLLEILEVEARVVVVSRWYGGTHLGPDRFKHINNAARAVLQMVAAVPGQADTKTKKKKKGK